MKKSIGILLAILLTAVLGITLTACAGDPSSFSVTYIAGEGGSISGETTQTVERGGDANNVTATASSGYEFEKWSDGVTTAKRTDKNITKDISVTAQFRAQKFTLKYNVEKGGTIQGNSTQFIEYGKDGTEVKATANEGYEFEKWSDGVTTAERTDTEIIKDITLTASFTAKTFTMTYLAAEGGRIEGNSVQTAKYMTLTEEVIAVANPGYKFVMWDDGNTGAKRREIVKGSKTVTATFEEIEVTFKLNYQSGQASPQTSEVTLDIHNYNTIKYPVPTKENFSFVGWYVGLKLMVNNLTVPKWYQDEDKQITDSSGQVIIDSEVLAYNSETHELYAKWTANETFTYKILLVYVTRIDAVLPDIYQNYYTHVDYTMSGLEKKLCQATTKQLIRIMNWMTDGLVNFEIDEYYTTETIRTEDFLQPSQGPGRIGNTLHPNQIKEVSGILDDYDSALSMYFLNDYPSNLRGSSGSAVAKYGEVYLESYWSPDYTQEECMENLISNSNSMLWMWLEVPIHELAHTIEMRINAYSYHDSYGGLCAYEHVNAMQANKLYYLQEIDMDGVKAGIPYRFWKREIAKVTYLSTEGGYVSYSRQEVVYGMDAKTAFAETIPGYRFVGWSDGVQTTSRTERNVQGDFTVTANFELIEYTVNFAATEGGTVQGRLSVIVRRNESTGFVKAVAKEGYRFVKWSDGNPYNGRSFIVDVLNVSMFDENNSLTITAIFEKIE